ncbi:hypothetical protein Hanom_Chr16g01475421 [Helianthus anomalus]
MFSDSVSMQMFSPSSSHIRVMVVPTSCITTSTLFIFTTTATARLPFLPIYNHNLPCSHTFAHAIFDVSILHTSLNIPSSCSDHI